MLLLFAIYENTKTFYNHKTVAEQYLKIQFVASLDTNGADFKMLCKLTENVKTAVTTCCGTHHCKNYS